MTSQLSRRALLQLAAGTFASQAIAQQKQASVGLLLPSTELDGAFVKGVRQGLLDSGLVEGRDYRFIWRSADTVRERLPALAREIVGLGLDVIIANAIDASVALRDATKTVPIVFSTANDPVRFGLVESYNRPGGNLTGVSYLNAALSAKRFELITEFLAGAGPSLIAVIVNPRNANAEANYREVQAAASSFQLLRVDIATEEDLPRAMEILRSARPQALIVNNDPILGAMRSRLVPAINAMDLPAIYPAGDFVEAGGLMSYSANLFEAHRQAGTMAARILKGARPQDLPVVQPTDFELVINMRTARQSAINIPQHLMVRAARVIE